MQHLAARVEQHCCDKCLALLLPLLVDHAVEAADRVGLQSAHRPAAVENEDHFSQILFHGDSSFVVQAVCFLYLNHTTNLEEKGQPAGDILL